MSVWRLPQGARIPMPASGFLTWRPKLRKNDRRNTGKNLLQFTRPPANADFCAKRRKIFFASRFYLTPMWITFVYTHACTLSSDLLADFPCIYMIFPDFPLLFCPVIHTLFFLFIPSSQSFCQPVFFLRSLFFAEVFIINLSIQGRFFDE